VIVQSRAGYLGLVVAVLVSFIFLAFRYRDTFTKHNLVVGTVAFLMLSAAIMLFYFSLDNTRRSYFVNKIPVWQYFRSYENASAERLLRKSNAKPELSQMAPFDFSEEYYENANLRIIFWKKSFCMIKSNPILGVGAGNWRIAIPSCPQPENPEHTIKNYTYSQPHNEWIGIISELGIPGFILAVFIFFIPVGIVFYRIIRAGPKPHVSVLFYGSFIIGFYVFCFFDFPMKRVEHNVILFSVFAFMLHKVPLRTFFKHKGHEGSHEVAQRKSNQLKYHDRLIRRTISLLFVILLIFSIIIAAFRIKGEYYTAKIFRYEKQDDEKVIYYCKKAENVFYPITPNTLPVAWFEGVARYRKGDVDSAIMCFEKALKVTPYEVRVLNDYAAALYNLKKTDEAKSVLRYTLYIDPHFDDARFNLGAIYYFTGKNDSAIYQVKKCRESQKKEEFLEELME
jgi:tetratricopeptide (TPR) repeat protein